MAKDIIQQVGQGCPNLLDDIMTLQTLLNAVPDLWIERPGDCQFNSIDGIITPQFRAALTKFQERSMDMRQEGSKIMPGGFTVSRLNAWQSDPPLSRHGTFTCPHGGIVTVVGTGKPEPRLDTLSINATLVVAGCPMMMGAQPAPCLQARFLGTSTPNLVSVSTPSLCTGAMGPSGPIMVLNAGTRYI